jgi:NADPH-dependent F420 reductase
MDIAIIGTGNVGGALARACVTAGHAVVLASRHAEHAQKVASEVGARAAGTAAEAVQGAELVVLAVPSTATAPLVEELGERLTGKIVIDPTNPMNLAPAEIFQTPGSVPEVLHALAPGVPFVKAFNTIFAGRLGQPASPDGVPLDGFYAGDDPEAKAAVARLLADLGFRPLDVGPLAAARTLELMAYLNIDLNVRNDWPWRSGWKLLD